MKNFLQVKLRTLLVAAGIVAMVAWAYAYWNSPKRVLIRSIVDSNLSENEKYVLTRIARSTEAWRSGLVAEITRSPPLMRPVWQSSFVTSDGDTLRVFLLDKFVRPAAWAPSPLVLVILNKRDDVLYWELVAPWALGFLDASIKNISGKNILTISALANWTKAEGIYEYSVDKTGVAIQGEPIFRKTTENPRKFFEDVLRNR